VRATTLLARQHRTVRKLFKKIVRTDDPRLRRSFLYDVRECLRLHTAIEEEIFYPAVRGLDSTKAAHMVLAAPEEHHVLDLVLAELPRVNPASAAFEAKVAVLRALVRHHVDDEEARIFPHAEKRLGKRRSRALAAAMAERADGNDLLNGTIDPHANGRRNGRAPRRAAH
jgi:hypothetical protein